jgi:chitinase
MVALGMVGPAVSCQPAKQNAAPAANVAAPAAAPSTADGLPRTFVAGYLEAYKLELPSTLPAEYDVLYHAFAPIDWDGGTRIYTTNNISRAQLAAEYKARKAAGKPTILSVGGEGGAAVGLTTAAQQARFMATVVPLIEEFGFSGIDWDLELHIPGGISADGIVSISRQLRAQFPGFAVTMAPFGHPQVEPIYKNIARQLVQSGDLAYVGFQFYNDTAVPTAESVLWRMQAWMAETGITARQFVIGLWYGPDDWRGHVTTHAQMVSIWNGVKATHPDIRGVYTWGILTSDKPNGYGFARNLSAPVKG